MEASLSMQIGQPILVHRAPDPTPEEDPVPEPRPIPVEDPVPDHNPSASKVFA